MAEEKPRSLQPLLSSASTRLFMKRSVMGDCMPGIVRGAGTYREQVIVPGQDSAKWMAESTLRAQGRRDRDGR